MLVQLVGLEGRKFFVSALLRLFLITVLVINMYLYYMLLIYCYHYHPNDSVSNYCSCYYYVYLLSDAYHSLIVASIITLMIH